MRYKHQWAPAQGYALDMNKKLLFLVEPVFTFGIDRAMLYVDKSVRILRIHIYDPQFRLTTCSKLLLCSVGEGRRHTDSWLGSYAKRGWALYVRLS